MLFRSDDLIRYIDRDVVERAQQGLSKFDSEGQKRMASLVRGNLSNLEISPNPWAGIGLVRSGAGTALVGDPSTVAQRMLEYADLGIDTSILSGYPHLEEAYRVAELLFPLLPLSADSGAKDGRAPAAENFVGNEFRPIK